MSLTVERTSPTTLVVTRALKAPPDRVYAAHLDPALLRRWLGGYEGWDITRCEVDARAGGGFLYRFDHAASGGGFTITGTFEALEPPAAGRPGRTVHVEVMHMPDPTPENHVTTEFAPDGTGTLLTMTMRVADEATMDAMVATGMTDGMEVSYRQLDALEPAAA